MSQPLPTETLCLTEIRPWGQFSVVCTEPGYRVRQITLHPGHRVSEHLHHHRQEHFVVVQGTAHIVCDQQESMLHTGQSILIPPCTPHRIANPGVIRLVLIEVSTGEYVGADDVIRFHDDYNRE